MGDDGWSRALVASTGVPVSSSRDDDEVRALAHEAGADGLEHARMAELATSRHPVVREAIAARKDLTLALQAALVHDRKRGVRVALAANGTLTTPIARELLKDREASVLKALARNDGVADEILMALTRHRREEVAHLARRSRDARTGGALAPTPSPRSVGELEDGARERARAAEERRRAAEASPADGRSARAYAPRPSARGAAPAWREPRLHP